MGIDRGFVIEGKAHGHENVDHGYGLVRVNANKSKLWMEEAMKNQMKNAVRRSFARLLREDGTLFECPIEKDSPYDARKLHEVCVNHRLANHLQDEVLPLLGREEKMFVDIEFNREGGSYKNVGIYGKDRIVRPDIIIHNRISGPQKNNFLVVECKKREGTSPAEIDEDRLKISALMEDQRYEYSFGLQVIYEKKRIKGVLFFRANTGIDQEEIDDS